MLYAHALNASLAQGNQVNNGTAIIQQIIRQGAYQSEYRQNFVLSNKHITARHSPLIGA